MTNNSLKKNGFTTIFGGMAGHNVYYVSIAWVFCCPMAFYMAVGHLMKDLNKLELLLIEADVDSISGMSRTKNCNVQVAFQQILDLR